MCQAYPFPTGPAHLEALLEAQRSSSPPKSKFACPGCGGTLFGNLNENCANCNAASTVPALIPFPLPSLSPGEALGLGSGGGGDFAGGGATGSFGD